MLVFTYRAGVGCDVLFEVRPGGEPFVAVRACEGLLSRVYAHVSDLVGYLYNRSFVSEYGG